MVESSVYNRKDTGWDMGIQINTAGVIVGLSGVLMAMAVYAALFTDQSIVALTYGIAAIWGMMAANFYVMRDR